MSSNYDEGPYLNWSAIHFPSGVYKITIVVNNSSNRIGFIAPYDGEGAIRLGVNPEVFQAIITGKTSGASVDFRNLPVVTSASVGGAGSPPACERTSSNYYLYPTGSPVPAASAWSGGTIIDATSPATGIANVVCASSYSFVPGDPDAEPPTSDTCEDDTNAPALPAFISGEELELTAE